MKQPFGQMPFMDDTENDITTYESRAMVRCKCCHLYKIRHVHPKMKREGEDFWRCAVWRAAKQG